MAILVKTRTRITDAIHGDNRRQPTEFCRRCCATIRTVGLVVVIAACMAAGLVPYAHAEPAFDEQAVKAAFIFNFAKFVEWPQKAFADTGTPITIGILRNNAFADVLERTVKDKTVDGRKLVVKRFNKVRDIQKCHIVFVSASEKASVSDVLDRAKGTSWLTIGETEGFAQRGGIINLIKEEKRFRFEINVKSAKKAELKISSKLLKLAKIVED